MTELEHVIAERDDDELRVLRPIFDVVRNNRDISEVEGSVNLVHEIQRRRLSESKLDI